jgi:hypothetical protein
MQKPFKRQPEFDAMLAGVLRADPAAVLVLHAATESAANQHILVQLDDIRKKLACFEVSQKEHGGRSPFHSAVFFVVVDQRDGRVVEEPVFLASGLPTFVCVISRLCLLAHLGVSAGAGGCGPRPSPLGRCIAAPPPPRPLCPSRRGRKLRVLRIWMHTATAVCVSEKLTNSALFFLAALRRSPQQCTRRDDLPIIDTRRQHFKTTRTRTHTPLPCLPSLVYTLACL